MERDERPLVHVGNPVTPDDVEALSCGLTLEELDLLGSRLTPAFRFFGSPVVWRLRLHAHYDGVMRIRTELLRQYSDGSLAWGGVEEAALFDTPNEAILLGLDAANACERLLSEREDLVRLWEVPPRPLAFASGPRVIDLDGHFGRRWRLAKEGHRVPPSPDVSLALATDEGDVHILTLRRGRYPAGGLALELADQDGSRFSMLTADGGLSRSCDPFVCLDVVALGPEIGDWVERNGLGRAVGQDLRCDDGERRPLFEMSEAFVVALPQMPSRP